MFGRKQKQKHCSECGGLMVSFEREGIREFDGRTGEAAIDRWQALACEQVPTVTWRSTTWGGSRVHMSANHDGFIEYARPWHHYKEDGRSK